MSQNDTAPPVPLDGKADTLAGASEGFDAWQAAFLRRTVEMLRRDYRITARHALNWYRFIEVNTRKP